MLKVLTQRSSSFQTKVLVPVVAFLILIPATFVWIVNRHIEEQARSEAWDTLTTARAVFKNSLDIRKRHLKMRLENAVREPRFKSTVLLQDPATTTAFLENTLSEYTGDADVILFNPIDPIAASGVARDDTTSLESFERRAKFGIERALSGELNSALVADGGRLFEVVSVPAFISEGSNLIGALTIGAELSKTSVEELKTLTHTDVLLLAGDKPLVSTFSPLEEEAAANAFFRNFKRNEWSIHSAILEGEHFHYLSGEMPGLNPTNGTLRFILFSSYESRLAALAATRGTLLALSAIGIAFSIFIIWIYIKRIMRPLHDLRAGAEAVGLGDYSKRIQTESRDECGALAEAFNQMTENVQGAQKDLEKTVSELSATQEQLLERESRLRESEEGLRLIIEGARDHAIFTLDDKGSVLRWNNASKSMLGYTQEASSALSYSSFFSDEDCESGVPQELLAEATANGRSEFEGWRIRNDGSRFWADVTLSRLQKIEGSETGGFVEITRDITARKQAEEALRAARDAAESSDRAKSEFLANMSHEVRTPMNGIIGMSSLLLDQDITQEQRDFAETIRASADSMLAILDDILDISKIESGQLEVELGPVNILDLIEETILLFQKECDEKQLTLNLYVSDSIPGIVNTDASRFRQSLVAIVGNAVRFTPEGKITVNVEFDRSQEQLNLSVRDTGIGIDDDYHDDIFSPFFQIESSLSRQYGGTGLGLAIARNIIELLGGSISVSSSLGNGSTFSFGVKAKPEDSPSPLARIDGLKALVATSRSDVLDYLIQQLSIWGCEAIAQPSQNNLEECLRRREDYDFAVVDTSFELNSDSTGKYRDGSLATRIIRVSSEPHSQRTSDHLAYPLRPSRLNASISRIISSPESESRTVEKEPEIKSRAAFDQEFGTKHPMKILVVEDNAINTKLLVKILRKMGYEAATAANGLKGFEAAEAGSFDFIFMDLQMPIMDGLESARKILASNRIAKLPYIAAFTANAHQSDRDECDRAGFHDFVSKPARPAKIQAVLERGYAWVFQRSLKN